MTTRGDTEMPMPLTGVVDQPISIELSENPTTGYRWQIDVPPPLRVVEMRYAPATGGMTGAGGARVFVVASPSPGQFTLTAKLCRSWLGDASVIERKTFIATVSY